MYNRHPIYNSSNISILLIYEGIFGNHEQFCVLESLPSSPRPFLGPGCKSRVDPSCSRNFASIAYSEQGSTGDERGSGPACTSENREKWYDADGHGSHVGGIAGGLTTGVYKHGTLCSVRVLDSTGTGWGSDIIAAIAWVADIVREDYHSQGHQFNSIISMSLGGPRGDPDRNNHPLTWFAEEDVELIYAVTGKDPSEAVRGPGIVTAVAAGNDGDDAW